MNVSTAERIGAAAISLGMILFLSFSPLYLAFAEGTNMDAEHASSEGTENSAENGVSDAQRQSAAAADAPQTEAAHPSGTEGISESDTEEPMQEAEGRDMDGSQSGFSDGSHTATGTDDGQMQDAGNAVSAEADLGLLLMASSSTATTTATSSGFAYTSTTTSAATTTTEGLPGIDASTTQNGETAIVSGDAVALANVINLVNSNIINSNGVVVFQNFLETLLEDFDLRDFYNALLSPVCSLTSCGSYGVETRLSNDTSITNDITAEAVSGRNQITDGGSSAIATGNAYAGVNLVNIANTNVIDSNYLLVSLNAFADVNSDIVFPTLSNFFSTLGNGTPLSTAAIANAASVTNAVSLDADSGGNTASSTGTSTIMTGASTATGNIFNQLNTSLVGGGQNVSIMFRVQGNWAGEIFNAPENLKWMEDGTGGIYLFDTDGAGGSGSDPLSVHATNSASIDNRVNVMALTGENAINGAETATISTGKAYAGVNIMNVANATIVGRNWVLAILNIFGDFNGNISFGQPDLWVAGQVNAPERIQNGSDLVYKLTVINNGDAPMSDVVLKDAYDAAHLDIYDSSAAFTKNADGSMEWKLPKLAPGAATEVTYSGRVKDAGYATDITSTLSVSGRETDGNRVDNTDTVTVTTASRSRGNGVKLSLSSSSHTRGKEIVATTTLHGSFKVERLVTPAALTVGDGPVTQTLKLTNVTDVPLPAVVFRDLMRDPNGSVVSDETWDLGDVKPREEIDISYEINFKRTALTGLYTLESRAQSNGADEVVFANNGSVMLMPYTESTPLVTAQSPGIVLGASTTGDMIETIHAPALGALVAEASDGQSHPQPYGRSVYENIIVSLAALIAFALFYRFFLRAS